MFSDTSEVCGWGRNWLVWVAGVEKVGVGLGGFVFVFFLIYILLPSLCCRDATVGFFEVLEKSICMITRLPPATITNVLLHLEYLVPEKSGPFNCFCRTEQGVSVGQTGGRR